MSSSRNRKDFSGFASFPYIYIVCFLLCSLTIFLFQYLYFPERYATLRVMEMDEIFEEEEFFTERAKAVLNTRSDVGYVRLLDENGITEKSFGYQQDEGYTKLALSGPEGKKILMGIKPVNNRFYSDSLLWSILFGALMAAILSYFIRFVNSRSFRFLEEFSKGINSVARGNYRVSLDENSFPSAGKRVKRLCREFNEMVFSLENKPTATDDTEESEIEFVDLLPEQQEVFQPQAGTHEEIEGMENQKDRETIVEQDEDITEHEVIEIVDVDVSSDMDVKTVQRTTDSAGDNAYDSQQGSGTELCVVVIRIAEYENVVQGLSPSDINSLMAKYRKSISETVTSFRGDVEAMLRDEVVVFFTNSNVATDISAKLSSVCSAVEMIQFFASASGRLSPGLHEIKLKIGISSTIFPSSTEADVSLFAKSVVDEAKVLCSTARAWNILVTTDFRESLKDYLVVRREKVGNRMCYAVTGVEEEALEQLGK